MKHLTPADIMELVISTQGITLIYGEQRLDPTTSVQHQLGITPDALDAEQAEMVQTFMATIHEIGQAMLAKQAGPDAAPYDNPEDGERYGAEE